MFREWVRAPRRTKPEVYRVKGAEDSDMAPDVGAEGALPRETVSVSAIAIDKMQLSLLCPPFVLNLYREAGRWRGS